MCKKFIKHDRKDNHNCEEWFCRNCSEYVPTDHQCYIRALDVKEAPPRFIFFDFECIQSDTMVTCKDGPDISRDVGCMVCQNVEDPCLTCRNCRQCKQSWCGQQRHVPNLAIAHSVCEHCIETNPDRCTYCGNRCSQCDRYDEKKKAFKKDPCTGGTCGSREMIIEGTNVGERFGQYLFQKNHKTFTIIAHNFQGYDSYFIMEYLLNHGIRPDSVIYSGSKILYLHVSSGLDIRLLDSLNFLPMALSKLPEAFNLEQLVKGYWPHYFNKSENQDYVGPYPGIDYYGVDTMNNVTRDKFLKWHTQKISNNEIFNFKKQIIEYCRDDVLILKGACLKLRSLLMKITETSTEGIDPFRSITIAGVCTKLFRSKFLKEHWFVKLEDQWCTAIKQDGRYTVFHDGSWIQTDEFAEKQFVSSSFGQIPSNGYVCRDNYSRLSILWLEWIMESNRRKGKEIDIIHALNKGEYKIPMTKYKADGYDPQTNTTYWFHGCLFHGCDTCFATDRGTTKTKRTRQSLHELYTLTWKQKKRVQELGFKYVSIWEHEFKQMLKMDPEMNQYLSGVDIQDRLDPREAFYGGRCEAICMNYVTNPGEVIRYVDFCSLYPACNKYAKYPVGHPIIVTRDFEAIENYFGIIKLKILPPKRLMFPVLPCKINGKLIFGLCNTCAQKNNQKCNCTDQERAIVGTWCTPEVCKALEHGYRVIRIYEIYHWENSMQLGRQEEGLFTEYINLFLKIKMENSGFPPWIETPEDQQQYIDSYLRHEDILLDRNNVTKNSPLRTLGKIHLNHFWGKYGERLNRTQSTFFHEREMDKFFQCFTDRTKKIKDIHIVSRDVIQVSWENEDLMVEENLQANIFIACFTTCAARLKLYGCLEKLGTEDGFTRPLYMDTDSVFYVTRPGEEELPIGDFLGDLTDELEIGDHITHFVAAGPKQYAYLTAKGNHTCKIRGFSLNYTNAKLLNFESLLRLITNKHDTEGSIVTENKSKISRLKYKQVIYNRHELKKYKIVFDKRCILEDFQTIPFGFT